MDATIEAKSSATEKYFVGLTSIAHSTASSTQANQITFSQVQLSKAYPKHVMLHQVEQKESDWLVDGELGHLTRIQGEINLSLADHCLVSTTLFAYSSDQDLLQMYLQDGLGNIDKG